MNKMFKGTAKPVQAGAEHFMCGRDRALAGMENAQGKQQN
jgi:hypothetical protein